VETTDLIYIDWNLFSILKEPKLETHVLLAEFLKENAEKITIVYSDAHLGDLSKTSNILLRNNDLEYLSKKTNDLTIVKYFGRDYVDVEKRNAKEFYNTNVYDNSDSMLMQFQIAVKNITDNWGGVRDGIIQTHFKTDPKNICNFSPKQLDELIKMIGLTNSLDEFVQFGLNLHGDTKSNSLTHIDYYMTAYMNLDLIGFYPDAMNEKQGFDNLLNDSKHSAYGSICKAFITNDNKCYLKSKFLFDYYGSKSKLIKTCKVKDISDFQNSLNEIIK